jgi:hypothetical protein
MKYKVYFSPNTIGTGTSTINSGVLNDYFFSDEWILVIPKSKIKPKNTKCKIIEISDNKAKFIKIIAIYLYIQILALLGRISHISVMANYFPFCPKKIHVSVILRHPYLIDLKTNEILPTKRRFLEFLRSIAFNLTLFNRPIVFVQSISMLNYFNKSYPKYPKSKIGILPNPISKKVIEINNSCQIIDAHENHYAYPSTYYEHKNFEFILKYIESYSAELKTINFVLHLFIDEIDVKKICSEFKVSINIIKPFIKIHGRVAHSKLLTIVKKCNLILFPSKRETFGNGIYESLALEKRVVMNQSNYSDNFINNENVDIVDMNDFNFLSEFHEAVISKKLFNKNQKFKPLNVEDWISILISKS